MKRADLLALCGIVLWVGASFWLFWAPGGPARELVVEAPDQAARHYDLAANRKIEIKGPLGVSIVEIMEHRARFLSSPCQGQYCVHAGWLNAGGDVAACLPNGVTIYLADSGSRYDSITY